MIIDDLKAVSQPNEKTRNKKMSLILFERYQYLAVQYSAYLRDAHKIGYTQEDVQQELSIRLYTSIISYGKRWKYYRETGRRKPICLKYWLQTTMNNRIKDFIKKASNQPIYSYSFSDGDNSIDIGFNETHDESKIDIPNHTFIVAGVDLLEGLTKPEAICFSLYVQGKQIVELKRVFKRHFDANTVIKNQIHKLSSNKDLRERWGKSNTFTVEKIYQ